MIKFRKIRWRNLLSTGNQWTEISLDENKATLIIGKNGSGKSTFLDALSFALYGKPYREINLPQLINSITKKQMVVEVEFSIGSNAYLVRRGLKPKVFEIYENDKLVDQDAAAKEYQEHLEKRILKIGHKAFCQVAVVGSAGYIPFMQLTTPDRRKVIEDILDIQIFSTMSDLLKSRVRDNKSALSVVESNVNLLEQKISLTKKHIRELENIAKDDVNEKKAKLKECIGLYEEASKDAKTLSTEIEELQTTAEDEDGVLDEISSLKQKKSRMQEHVHNATDIISFYKQNDDCPTCSQTIDSDFRENKITENKKQIEEDQEWIKDFSVSLEKATKHLEEIRAVNKKVSDLNRKLLTLNNDMKMYRSTMTQISEDLKKPKNTDNIENHKNELLKIEAEHEEVKGSYSELISEKKLYDKAAQLLKDGGIKTKIINQYVPVINSLVNKYLSAMDFFVQFEIDEQFNEKIKSRHRDEFSYKSFSEGEKEKINLSLLFTWRSISKLRNSASTNLLVLDEVFDSSLDEEGTDNLTKILKSEEFTRDTNVFIISHKMGMDEHFNKVYKFEKTNNFSIKNEIV